jgi:phosphohistidine phosphatase
MQVDPLGAASRRLYLLRHAKSSWDDDRLGDHERPLAPRGRKAGKQLARWLAEHDVRPDLVVCSSAVRTQQTFALVSAALGSPPVSTEEGLYAASSATLLARVRQLPDTATSALFVGHNPGLADLCLLLSRSSERRDRVAENLPTGALAVLDLPIDAWPAVKTGEGSLVELVLPREL